MKIILKKVIFSKDDFAVFKDSNDKIFQAKLLHNAEDLLETPLQVKAKEINHPKYGLQYKIESYKILENPLSFFLKRVVKSGLPKTTILELSEKYSLNEFKEILENQPHQFLSVKNIGKARLKKIKETFENKKELIELTETLSEANVSGDFLFNIYKFMQKNNIKADNIRKNPYLLTNIDGVGFKRADKIALNLGIDEYSLVRISAYIKYYIQHRTSIKGDTLFKKDEIFNSLIDELGLDKEKAEDIFNKAIFFLIVDDEVKEIESSFYELNSFYMMENYIIDLIKNYNNMKFWKNDISKDEVIKYILFNSPYQFSLKQKGAVIEFSTTDYPFFILAGYAGAGKTTTSKMIMDIYAQQYGTDKVVACALSGNASNRIKNVTGYKAYTIHSLLGYKGGKFEYNENNPLSYKLIVLDEASMVDIYLFYSLLKAIDFKKSKLFIIGDNAQLPPVGAGEVFSNMLEIPHLKKVILDKVFRQDENQVINIFAQDIRKGIVPKGYKDRYYNDFYFIKIEIGNYFSKIKNMKEEEKREFRKNINLAIRKKINNLSKKVFDEVLEMLKKGIVNAYESRSFAKFREYTYRYVYYYQIIAPQKDGIIGTIELNKEAKKIFNDTGSDDINKWDKVIHLRNKNKNVFLLEEYLEFKKEVLEINEEKRIEKLLNIAYGNDENIEVRRVFNGQVGLVIDSFYNESDNKRFVAVYFPADDYVAIYDDAELKNKILDLSYSFTIHKSQGSEYKIVAIPISLSNRQMLNNRLLYTAITRAKERLYLFGESYAFEMGIKTKDEVKRATLINLKERNA